MDGFCHGDNLRILLINKHKSYIVTADQIVSMTINRACASWLVGFLGYHHDKIHPSLSCLLPLYHPYIPSFKFFIYLYNIIFTLLLYLQTCYSDV